MPETIAEAQTPTPQPESAFAQAFKAALENPPQGTAEAPETPQAPQAKPVTPTPQAAEKPPEATKPPAEDLEMPAEIKSEKGRNSWKEWKAKFDAVAKERDEFQTKLKETEAELKSDLQRVQSELDSAKKSAVDPKEIEALKAERDEIRLRLRMRDVKEDPSWKSEIEQPLEAALQEAQMNVPKELRTTLKRLMLEPPSDARQDAIEQLIGELSPLKQVNVANALRAADAVSAKQAALLSNQKQLTEQYESYQKAERERQEAHKRSEFEKSVDEILSRATDPVKGLGVFQPIDDKPESKQAALEAARLARQYAAAEPNGRNMANLAAWAVQGEKSIPLLQAAHAEIQRLNAQLEKLTAKSPTSTSTPTGAQSQPTAKVVGFADKVRELMGNSG